MSWSNLVKDRIVQKHSTSRQEIENLRELVNRDLKDAELENLSDDRRFATAYNAVLQLSKMAISCSGHRLTTGAGHHRNTFEAVKVALSTAFADSLVDYFETCRRKRNKIDYDTAEVVTETEVIELIEKSREFQTLIENWIDQNHATYKK
jgi:uncharacterized protein (UPF0332 family)